MIALGATWRTVIRKAWSVRLSALAALLLLLEITLPMFAPNIPRTLFVVLALVAAIGSIWARVLVQSQIQEAVNGDDEK